MPAELVARKAQIASAQPFIKACLVPDSSWEFLVQTLDFPCWQPSAFRQLTWSLLNPELINDCIQNFIDDKDFNRFRDGVTNLKSFNKLIPAVIKIWDAFDEDQELAQSNDDFLLKLTKHVSVQDLVEKYSDRLRAVRGHSVFTDDNLTHQIRNAMERIRNPVPASQDTSLSVIEFKRGAGASTTHTFRQADAQNFCDFVKENSNDVGIIFLDPPFGIMDADWDVAWTNVQWGDCLASTAKNFPDAPVVTFMSFQQMPTVIEMAGLNGYRHISFYSWLKAGTVSHMPGRMGHPANPIMILSQAAKKYQKNSSHLASSNFVATPNVRKYKFDGEVVNPTEKPVVLLRAFINSFCPKLSHVVDLCSGSGSAAVAAASLGFGSFSCDLRESQFEAAQARLRDAMLEHTFYPSPDFVHDFQPLKLSLEQRMKPDVPKITAGESDVLVTLSTDEAAIRREEAHLVLGLNLQIQIMM